jgi:CHASE3 domain sensor protein
MLAASSTQFQATHNREQILVKSLRVPKYIVLAMVIAAAFLLLEVVVASLQVEGSYRLVEKMRANYDTIEAEQHLLQHLTDAETGQRGYLLTNNLTYLRPYTVAVGELGADLKRVGEVMPATDAAKLEILTQTKIQELSETVELQRSGRPDAARQLVSTNQGKNTMDAIRALLDSRQLAVAVEAERSLEDYNEGLTGSMQLTAIMVGAAALLLFLVIYGLVNLMTIAQQH